MTYYLLCLHSCAICLTFVSLLYQSLSCKGFTVIWQYSLLANYNWILMEGIYLHNLIFLYIFNDNTSIMKYVITGWGKRCIHLLDNAFNSGEKETVEMDGFP